MRRRALAVVLLGVFLLLGGCWDNRSIEHRAIVLMIGIEPAQDGLISVYFQVPTSQALSSLSVSSSPSSASPATYVVGGVGKTVAQAMTQAQAKSSGDLYLGQVQEIVLSSQLPAAQFEDVLDFLARIGPMDKTSYVAVSPDPIQLIMQHQPQEGLLPALYLTSFFSCRHCQEVYLSRTVWAAEQHLQTPGMSMWLPVMRDHEANFRIDQVALYRQGQPVMTLTPEQTVYLGYLLNATAKASLPFTLHGAPVSIRALMSRTATHVVPEAGGVRLVADLKVQGILDTLPPGEATIANLRTLEIEVSRGIAAQELTLIRSMQRQGVDPVGFLAPYLWQHQSLMPQANELYRNAGVEVRVHTRIIDVGDVL